VAYNSIRQLTGFLTSVGFASGVRDGTQKLGSALLFTSSSPPLLALPDVEAGDSCPVEKHPVNKNLQILKPLYNKETSILKTDPVFIMREVPLYIPLTTIF
jgi:hypothetical protein